MLACRLQPESACDLVCPRAFLAAAPAALALGGQVDRMRGRGTELALGHWLTGNGTPVGDQY